MRDWCNQDKKTVCGFSHCDIPYFRYLASLRQKPAGNTPSGLFHVMTRRLSTIKPRLETLSTVRVQVIKDGARANGDGSTARGYNYRWQQERIRFLREHPLCCYCQRDGRVEPATVVDHIIPHKGNNTLFWDSDNWQPLCKRCHDSTKKAEESLGRGA